MTDEDLERPTGRACPICKRPAIHRFRPFCSKRCSDIDLGRWFNGSYAISVDDPEQGMIGRDDDPY